MCGKRARETLGTSSSKGCVSNEGNRERSVLEGEDISAAADGVSEINCSYEAWIHLQPARAFCRFSIIDFQTCGGCP